VESAKAYKKGRGLTGNVLAKKALDSWLNETFLNVVVI
jgi:hypothetical protein